MEVEGEQGDRGSRLGTGDTPSLSTLLHTPVQYRLSVLSLYVSRLLQYKCTRRTLHVDSTKTAGAHSADTCGSNQYSVYHVPFVLEPIEGINTARKMSLVYLTCDSRAT